MENEDKKQTNKNKKPLNTSVTKEENEASQEIVQKLQIKDERDAEITKENEQNKKGDVKSVILATANIMSEAATRIAECVQQLDIEEKRDDMNNQLSDSEQNARERENASELIKPLKSSSSDENISNSGSQDTEPMSVSEASSSQETDPMSISEASSSQGTEPMSISEGSSSQDTGLTSISEGSSQNSELSVEGTGNDSDSSSESDSDQNDEEEKPKSSSDPGLGKNLLELNENEETVPERNFSLKGEPRRGKFKKFI